MSIMKAIGFANTFYTLWDVTHEDTYVTINHQHRQSGVKTNYFYFQNLSIDLDKAKAKFTELTGKVAPEPDTDLRGRTNSFHLFEEMEVYKPEEFDRGQYKGLLISECEDIDYLTWAFDNMLEGDRLKIAKKVLLDNGFVEDIDKTGVCTPDELKSQIHHRKVAEYENSLIRGLNFEDGEKVELKVKVHSIGGFSGHYGYTNIYTFTTEDLMVFMYKGGKEYPLEEGDEVTVKGTIKHNRYYSDYVSREVEETKILRMKIIVL